MSSKKLTVKQYLKEHPDRYVMVTYEFGSELYSHEELVAEIGSCFLQSHTNITERFEQSTAYIQGWLDVFKGNRKFIFSASTAAQKAVDYILGSENGTEEVTEHN